MAGRVFVKLQKVFDVISMTDIFLTKSPTKHWKLKTVNASSTTAIIQDI